MKLFALIGLKAALCGALAVPAPDSRLMEERSKLQSCTNFYLDWNGKGLAFLHAECYGYNYRHGEWNKVDAGIDLNKCMANADGSLQDREHGFFASTCHKLSVIQAPDPDSHAILFSATCDGPPPLGGTISTRDLGHFITVDNGTLTCFNLQEPYCPECWHAE
ncbi:hypothetical protein F5B22DRAFT_304959 [Xylaria bambusicola]|uniref:uncharacterized protein n=1 Tax=Xylaria bambusicola TaxID=326684 RepID=UPI0020080789|nr:uncharacterized protein F5B22DRAFT_304959 [Xylaria bambusicola]KAI0512494.1 hypothetical protein F5B22DRAFT_304959 [Xylaria bambusicola]